MDMPNDRVAVSKIDKYENENDQMMENICLFPIHVFKFYLGVIQ